MTTIALWVREGSYLSLFSDDGSRSDFLLVADSGPGERDAKGLIVPRFGKKPENHVALSMTMESFCELLLLTGPITRPGFPPATPGVTFLPRRVKFPAGERRQKKPLLTVSSEKGCLPVGGSPFSLSDGWSIPREKQQRVFYDSST